MVLTRRDTLAAAVACGLTAAARAEGAPAAEAPAREPPAAKDPPPRDPVSSSLTPAPVQKVFDETFPGLRCIRLTRRGQDEAAVFRGTFFDPANWWSTTVEFVNGESVVTPPLFHQELDAAGKVLEETYRPIDPKRLPRAVQAAYEKWNPQAVQGREHFWLTEVARGKPRVYRVAIIQSAVKAYRATFQEDGAVVEADPAVVP
jgi:hypothetical protein